MLEFFKGLWNVIKVIFVTILIVLVGFLIVKTVSYFKNDSRPNFFDYLKEELLVDGGRGDGRVEAEADEVPEEEKGKIEITDNELNNFDEYLDDIKDSENNVENDIVYPDIQIGDDGKITIDGIDTGITTDDEEVDITVSENGNWIVDGVETEIKADTDIYYDKDFAVSRDMITLDEFKKSNGNVIKTFTYRGKKYMYYSMVFYADHLKQDKIRFFGYFPADDFKSDFETALDDVFDFVPLKHFLTNQDIINWFSVRFPYPEISYHYLSNPKEVFVVDNSNVMKSAFLKFNLDDYDLYLDLDYETLKVVRHYNKIMGIKLKSPLQYELFADIADEFVFTNNYDFEKLYNYNFGRHLNYVGSLENVKVDFLYSKWDCPHDADTSLLSEFKVITEADCGHEGEEQALCYCCGEIVSRAIPKNGAHKLTIELDSTDSTCTNQGYTKEQCEVCDSIITTKKPLLPHFFGDLYELVEATCINDGYEVYKCTDCSAKTEKNIIPKLGHDYSQFVKTFAPTCQSKGCDIYQCTRCEDTIPLNQVDMVDCNFVYSSTIAPTCQAIGYDLYECTYCRVFEKRNSKDKVYHDYNFVETIAPSIHSQGYDLYKCSYCPETKKENYVGCEVHDLVSYSYVENDHDKIYKSCSVCGVVDNNSSYSINLKVTQSEVEGTYNHQNDAFSYSGYSYINVFGGNTVCEINIYTTSGELVVVHPLKGTASWYGLGSTYWPGEEKLVAQYKIYLSDDTSKYVVSNMVEFAYTYGMTHNFAISLGE